MLWNWIRFSKETNMILRNYSPFFLWIFKSKIWIHQHVVEQIDSIGLENQERSIQFKFAPQIHQQGEFLPATERSCSSDFLLAFHWLNESDSYYGRELPFVKIHWFKVQFYLKHPHTTNWTMLDHITVQYGPDQLIHKV